MSSKISKYEHDILKTIKKHFGDSENYYSNNEYDKNAYYLKLKDFNKRFYHSMDQETKNAFDKGKGSELKGKQPKILALRSSSAMTYTLFGNYKKFKFEANEYTDKNFEFNTDLQTIKGTNANLDVFLKGKEKTLFFEMKMCEWLLDTPSKDISIRYFNPENYSDSNLAEAAITCLKGIAKEPFEQYDALQMFKHTLGIYNYFKKNIVHNNIELLNCVWKFDDKELLTSDSKKKYEESIKREKTEFESFKKIMQPLIELFDKKFDIRLIWFSDLFEKLKIKADTDDIKQHKSFIETKYIF